MTAIFEWCISISTKALAVALCWMLIKFVMRIGKTTFRDFLETAALDIKGRGIMYRRKVLGKYQNLEQTAAPEEDNGCEVKATIR